MRVVGGRLRGRPLAGPRSNAIRPTSDRLRETLFNILAHGYGLPGPETRALDLFAGTGALGIEALSRGAAFALFVESEVEGRGLIRTNLDTLGLNGVAKLLRRDATKLGPAGTIAPFDLLFCDPPYGTRMAEQALLAAASEGWLRAEALAVLEDRAGADPALPARFEAIDRRTIGDSQLIFARRRS
jgi:16S rRNA (guanine966-N2)-methyltransferase